LPQADSIPAVGSGIRYTKEKKLSIAHMSKSNNKVTSIRG